jgi:hypothetical protein
MIQGEWFSRRGNECYLRVSCHPKRWYFPLGVDIRSSTTRYVCVGVLCFSLALTVHRGASPYTRSCVSARH